MKQYRRSTWTGVVSNRLELSDSEHRLQILQQLYEPRYCRLRSAALQHGVGNIDYRSRLITNDTIVVPSIIACMEFNTIRM